MQNRTSRQRSSSFEDQSLDNRSTMLSSPASSLSLSGDYIGLESCVDIRDDDDDDDDDDDEDDDDDDEDDDDDDDEDEELTSGNGGGGSSERRRRREIKTKDKEEEKEFPPPIPWLAQTGNLNSHMPWVMKRYHTSDGRLIIRVEKVKHHEYFRAHRANGRLTLHLIPMDDDFYEEEINLGLGGEAEEDDEGNAENEKGEGEEEEEGEERKEEKESVNSSSVEMNGGDGGGGGGSVEGGGAKCYMPSCMCGISIAGINPVCI